MPLAVAGGGDGEPAGRGAIRPDRATARERRVAAAAAWVCGCALLGLVLWTLPGFIGPHAALLSALVAGAAAGYLACGVHPLSRRGRWLAGGLLAAAVGVLVARSPAAAPLVTQTRFLVTAWSEGATPAVPGAIGWPLLAACALALACTTFEGLRRARPVGAVLVLLGWLALEWEFVDGTAGTAFWPAAALALAWLGAGRAQALAGRPAAGAPTTPSGAAPAGRWAAWRPLLLAAATGLPLMTGVALLPLNRPALGLGAVGRWLRGEVPAIAGIERAARLPGGIVPAAGGDTGGALTTNARFGLQTEGFAASDARLGGPLTTTDTEALRLTVLGGSPPPVIYLRGIALDTYTGRGWVESQAALQGGPPPFVPFFARRRPSFTLRIQPTGLVTSTLFTALTPTAVEVRPLAWDRLGNAWLPDPLPPSQSYAVRVRPPPDPAALPHRTPYFGYFRRRLNVGRFTAYLQLPPSLPARVGRLAQRWAAGTRTPLGQAMAVERHLLAIPYDLNTPAPPPGSDFVAAFLFQLHRGYCTYYSSAMAVMLRTLGIPTRWVTGFRVPAPAPGRTAVVTDAEAHAWVEAFIAPYGWLTFDPTPPGPTLSSPPTTVPATAVPAANSSPAGNAPSGSGGGAGPAIAPRLLHAATDGTAGAAAAALAALAALLLSRRLRERRQARLDPVAAAHRLWRSVEREAARRGYPRQRGTTPGEFAGLLAQAWPAGGGAAARLADAYGRLCYGPVAARPAAAAELGTQCRAVASGLRRLPNAGLRSRVLGPLRAAARWAAAGRPVRSGRGDVPRH